MKEFVRYVWFSVLSMVSMSVYILADTFFIALDMGAYGLAALNFAIPIYGVIFALGHLIGIGGAARFSMLRGQGRKSEAQVVYSVALVISLVLGGVVMFVGGVFARQISSLMGAYGYVLELTTVYLRVIALFGPAFIICLVLAAFARNDGAPRRSMIALASNSMLNIFLDYVFIFIFGWGMFGAALAAGLAHVAGISILLSHFWRFERPRPNWAEILKITGIGMPVFVANVSLGMVVAVTNIIVLGLAGNLGVAVYGVMANILFVLVSIYDGIAHGVQPLMSREASSAKVYLRYALRTMAVISLVVYVGIFFSAEAIATAFNSAGDDIFQIMVSEGMRIYFAGVLFVGFNIVIAMYFSSTGNVRPAQLISLLRGFVVILPMVFILSEVLGINGVWLALSVTEVIVAIIAVCFIVYSKRAHKA